ncbi:MAG: phosphopantetheine-binding protein [Polyangiaceae bacterium]|nr:phosphopantetheine-binding protein [Polyangiaceae bacterium]
MSDPLEVEIAKTLIDALELPDLEAENLDPQLPLFADTGLALDSIDALELAVALSKKYQIDLKAEDENMKNVFQSVHSLANYVREHQAAH